MRNYTGYIIDYSDGNLTNQKRKWFEGELENNVELRSKYELFKDVNDLMRAHFDLEEVKNDPDRQTIDAITSQLTSEFNNKPKEDSIYSKFIKNSLNVSDPELQKKLDNVRLEAEKSNVSDVTKQWVNEWDNKKQTIDPAIENRRAFISSSLNEEVDSKNTTRTNRSKTYAIRIAGFAVAAMIALLITIKTMSPSYTPDKLFQEYYKPLNTYYASSFRENSINNADQLIGAVEMYKQAQYKAAAAEFSSLMLKDSKNIATRFFSGITQLQLGEYNQAIGQLNEVISNNGDFKKEAQWYLGLAYLKAGETQKAKSLFMELSETKGYYKDQAQNLLNHLK